MTASLRSSVDDRGPVQQHERDDTQTHLLGQFIYRHLPMPAQPVAASFRKLADELWNNHDLSGLELTTSLALLAESQRCALRAFEVTE